jgi:hypothetical protein
MHLIKLCVGVDQVEELFSHQAIRLATAKARGIPQELIHWTRHMPKQRAAVEESGSLYWVIKGVVRARQKIVELRSAENEEGRSICGIVLDHTLLETRSQPRRPFQGWRYLKPEDAPADLGQLGGPADSGIPNAMRAELTELALI